MTAQPTAYQQDPWFRWGWLMGAIWLVFFAFPLVAIWTQEDDAARWWKLAVTVLIAGFMAGYIYSLRRVLRFQSENDFAQATHTGSWWLVILVLVTVALATQIGAGALTALPFLASYPIFCMPWRQVIAVCALLLIGGGGVAVALWQWDAAWLLGVSVMVMVISGTMRYFEEGAESHRALQGSLLVTEERERLARDVHDVIGHTLTVVTIKTELARRLVDVDPERAKVELDEVHQLSREALTEVRSTVGGLRVARLADEVESAARALRAAGIEVEYPSDVTSADPRYRIAMAWALREAVTNVVRHSRARRCIIEIGQDRLVVTDDGKGMEQRDEGNGLRGLRERAALANATLLVASPGSGRGTRVEVSW